MKKQILLIDDAQKIHPLVAALLADEPVEIQSAYNAEYGLTLAASLRPDLILLDVEMPGTDGYETCRRLKADPDLFNTPVIFLTALGTAEEKVRGLELGAVDYVTKPFNPSELLARVRAALRSHHVVQLLEEKALVDFLTGLGNRVMFKQRLDAEIALRVRTEKPLACLAIDVEDFQGLNNTCGHPFADRVLQTIAKLIREVCRAEDVPCRLTGDSFAVLTPNTSKEDAEGLARRLLAKLANLQIDYRGTKVIVKCSVSIAPSLDVYDRLMWERANQSIAFARKNGLKGVAMAEEEASVNKALTTETAAIQFSAV